MSADLAPRRFYRNRVRKLITSGLRHVTIAALQVSDKSVAIWIGRENLASLINLLSVIIVKNQRLGPVRNFELALTFFHNLGYRSTAYFALRLSIFDAFDGPIGAVGRRRNNTLDNNFD